ncbi:MAG: 8-amino-7-oxononanoate synthase [Nitrospirota bacterium]
MFLDKISRLRDDNLVRIINDRQSPQGARIRFRDREYLNFSSNDYLGFANHPLIVARARQALEEFGFGAGASRLLGGGSRLHNKIEKRVAGFKKTDSALVFNSGYAANTGIIPAIADDATALFSDELNHASIIDGCRLSQSRTHVYRHKDMSHLEDLLRQNNTIRKIIITDSIFSMEGDIAPVRDLCNLCKAYDALLYLDDAHATGVIGEGRGVLAHFRIEPEPWIFQMGTFSKALGSFGAFLAGSADVIEWVRNSARSFMFSTALPACVIAASGAALELVENTPGMLDKLWENRQKAADGIRGIGYDIMGSETPIIPVATGTIENTMRISGHLFAKGIYAAAIRPPTVKQPRIRISVTAAHTDEDIGRLIDTLKEAA